MMQNYLTVCLTSRILSSFFIYSVRSVISVSMFLYIANDFEIKNFAYFSTLLLVSNGIKAIVEMGLSNVSLNYLKDEPRLFIIIYHKISFVWLFTVICSFSFLLLIFDFYDLTSIAIVCVLLSQNCQFNVISNYFEIKNKTLQSQLVLILPLVFVFLILINVYSTILFLILISLPFFKISKPHNNLFLKYKFLKNNNEIKIFALLANLIVFFDIFFERRILSINVDLIANLNFIIQIISFGLLFSSSLVKVIQHDSIKNRPMKVIYILNLLYTLFIFSLINIIDITSFEIFIKYSIGYEVMFILLLLMFIQSYNQILGSEIQGMSLFKDYFLILIVSFTISLVLNFLIYFFEMVSVINFLYKIVFIQLLSFILICHVRYKKKLY